MLKRFKSFFINLILPVLVFGGIAGILTGAIVTLYKFCAKHILHFSEIGYEYIKGHLYFIPITLVALFGLAFLFYLIFKKNPDAKGGGIPSSIAILRGVITFKWLRTLISVFAMSLSTFLIGVPLGNEGPSVLIGTAVGRASLSPLTVKKRAWRRYATTGGACAGFAIATGAPVSGIMFAVEEAHQRISPMIIIVACVSVLFARVATELLSPVLGVSVELFPNLRLISLSLKDIWIPLVIGGLMGVFAVGFLYCYRFINWLFNRFLIKIPSYIKIFAVFAITFAVGLASFSFISTGHELILSLFDTATPILLLLLILIVRSILTLSANANKITGGIFLPILALGALFSAILGKTFQSLFGLGEQYYTIILALGITACISGMMKMPLTAIIFSIEALSCHQNVLYVVIVSVVAFIITELFSAKSINDSVVENTVKERYQGKTPVVIDTFVEVQKGAFAVGKQIRDILWPANLFVLSVKPKEDRKAEVDQHGGRELFEGDILHVRYSTYNEKISKKELIAILGDQTIIENTTEQV